MKSIKLGGWNEFAGALQEIDNIRQDLRKARPGYGAKPLFRGVGRLGWGLETTLERACPGELSKPITDLGAYYNFISPAHPGIETLTEKAWPIPSFPDFCDQIEGSKTISAAHFFNTQISVYRFFIYLRHHGYPSPLLDWTESPYVAAFFAFDAMPAEADCVSIFASIFDSVRFRSGCDPEITVLGPYVTCHRRHMIQQSTYTICTLWNDGARLCSHNEVIKNPEALGTKGQAIRIDIPAADRSKALKNLDAMNVNPYSLFNTEESLMRTLARRAGLFESL